MWQPLLQPGLGLLAGSRRLLPNFCQTLSQHALHTNPGAVLWLDGAHCFNPYDFAEQNLQAGYAADDGADRMLIKRCMTAFQWDTVLTQHLDEKLLQVDASMVIAAPFDRLLTHEELQDWEQEDYTRYALHHLKNLTRRYQIPILLAVDMDRLWRTHPILARATYEAAHHRWAITHNGYGFCAAQQDGSTIDAGLHQITLLNFLPENTPLFVSNREAPSAASSSMPHA